jgi:hypothetical protein
LQTAASGRWYGHAPLDTAGRQRGFAGYQGNEVITQGIQFVGNSVEKLRTLDSRQCTIGGISRSGGQGSRIDFGGARLDEVIG